MIIFLVIMGLLLSCNVVLTFSLLYVVRFFKEIEESWNNLFKKNEGED